MAEKDKSGKDKSGKEIRVVVYIGNDNKYFDNIRQRYINLYQSDKYEFDFHELWGFEEDNYYGMFINVLSLKPNIVYIDVTERTEQLLDIAFLVSQDIRFHKVPVVGLIESPNMIHPCRSAGLSFTHIKCAEYHDLVYDPMCVAFPSDAIKPEFVEAKFSENMDLVVDFKILSISATGLHVEGNIRLEKGQVIELRNYLPKNIVPSSRYVVKQIYNKNLYYDAMYGYDLDFVFVDEPLFDEKGLEIVRNKTQAPNEAENKAQKEEAVEVKKIEERVKNKAQQLKNGKNSQDEKAEVKEEIDPKIVEKMKRERIAEYQLDLEQAKKKHRDWVLDHLNDYKFPKTKVLLVDMDMDVLGKLSKSLEGRPYIIRTQTALDKELWVIDKVRPDIIAFKYFYDEQPEEEGEAVEKPDGEDFIEESDDPFSAVNQLLNLIKKVKEEERYQPFIVIFNCDSYDSESFRNTFGYPKVLVVKEKINLPFILGMAKMHEEKNEKRYKQLVSAKIAQLKKENPEKYRNLKAEDFEEQKYEIKKNVKLSFAEARYKVTMTRMTESEVGFKIDTPLELKTYRFDEPIPLSIYILPPDEKKVKEGASKAGEFAYDALIHSVGEDRKKSIRLFVNDFFFESVNEQREKDKAEFQQKNQAFIEKSEADSGAKK